MRAISIQSLNKKHIYIFLAIILSSFSAIGSPIKLGKATIILSHDESDSISLKNISPSIIYSTIFADPFDFKQITMQRDNNTWRCTVPMETHEAVVGLRIDSINSCVACGFLDISQDSLLTIHLKVNSQNRIAYHINKTSYFNRQWNDGRTGMTDNITTKLMQFITESSNLSCNLLSIISAEDFNNFHIINDKFDKIYQCRIEDKFSEIPIPRFIRKWISNNIKLGYAATYRLAYRKLAKRWYEMNNINTYPDEYYSFLADINFTENTFLRFLPVSYTPYYFLYQLLSRFDEIPPIGNMNFETWQEIASNRLSNLDIIIDDYFIKMLLATSYMAQIRDNMPLSSIQLEYISHAFDDDLGLILQKENSILVDQLKSTKKYYDYTSEDTFDLLEFINNNAYGEPIVVDLWNTWCGPCLTALDRISSIKGHTHSGITYIYICDTSSDTDAYKSISDRLDGIHIRISQTAMNNLLSRYGCDSFPSYLFFADKYELSKIYQSYPGDSTFKEELELLTTKNKAN
ncbi:MAG: hypothetical protein HDS68_00900 [Bacteroidales bacterium]|nr:hypothetical protein [Bacteroidales bacterium]